MQPENSPLQDASLRPLLAVIPARAGSKGLPGKNLRCLAGLPLLAHAIRFSQLAEGVDRCIVSTDGEEIAAVARRYGGEAPFLRPAELAGDTTPMLDVLRHALLAMEKLDGRQYRSLLLLQPTSPARLPEDLSRARRAMADDAACDGVVAVSEPEFNPRFVCVEERGGYMVPAFGATYVRRQDAPPVYRVNGLLYLYRREHVLRAADLDDGRIRMLTVDKRRAFDIDDEHDLRMAELALAGGVVQLPWLVNAGGARS